MWLTGAAGVLAFAAPPAAVNDPMTFDRFVIFVGKEAAF